MFHDYCELIFKEIYYRCGLVAVLTIFEMIQEECFRYRENKVANNMQIKFPDLQHKFGNGYSVQVIRGQLSDLPEIVLKC